jgi:rare lipoprotein A
MRNFKQQGAATGTLEGEPMSVAHPSLPIGTTVRVTNTDNNEVIYATVTNRITASTERIVDLSPDAALAIGIPPDQTGPVLLERANPPVESVPEQPVIAAPPAPAPAPPPKVATGKGPCRIIPRMPDPGSTTVFRVQVGSYAMPLHAKEAFERMVAAGFHPYYEQFDQDIRVVIPGVPAQYIPWIAERLGNLDVTEAWIRPESY